MLTRLVGAHFERPIDRYPELTQVCFLLVIICQIVMGISRRDGDFLMGMLSIILSLICKELNDTNVSSPGQTLKQMPLTYETVASKFGMDGKVIIRAVCTKCHANYDPVTGPVPYPSMCTNWPTPETQCNACLLDENGQPLKTFTAHSFEDYLASIFSSPVLERHIIESSHVIDRFDQNVVKSAHDAEFLRTFRGPDGELFCVSGNDEARLSFALCIDFFATEGMRVRGPSTSVGIIALACLELPVDIRYKPEHMYLVGIIPGPTEPSLTQLNHYTNPIITDMLTGWHKGFWLTRTALKPEGRMARTVIAIVVCDLPAARKTAQLASSTSKIFCSVCDCWDVRDEAGNIVKDWQLLRGRHDCDRWQIRDVKAMRSAAERWRDAKTVAEQGQIFSEYGVRWSPLWRLPYWNPCRQLVVDSMHCLLEGLVKFHCLSVLHLTEAAAHARSVRPPAFAWGFHRPDVSAAISVQPAGTVTDEADARLPQWTEKDLKGLSQIHAALTAELCDEDQVEEPGVRSASVLQKYLAKCLYRHLVYVLEDLELTASPSSGRTRVFKEDIARALVQWVSLLHVLVSKY